jgi:hypothetical protein
MPKIQNQKCNLKEKLIELVNVSGVLYLFNFLVECNKCTYLFTHIC